MFIKICGITRLQDALLAAELGAHALGYNFYPKSKRYLPPAHAAQIHAQVRARYPHIIGAGIFVNASLADMQTILAECGLDWAQCHGDEPEEVLAALGNRGLKAVRAASLEEARGGLQRFGCRENPPALLLDAAIPGEYGGSGQRADWNIAAALAQEAAILLAGGLTPQNVAQAVSHVHPWGVDVASGVESAPGIKNPNALRVFIHNANSHQKD
ncbi:MAG: phosphoribosylanthranilate isomerase [Anaerolineales bacterium]